MRRFLKRIGLMAAVVYAGLLLINAIAPRGRAYAFQEGHWTQLTLAEQSQRAAVREPSGFVVEADDGAAKCRPASMREESALQKPLGVELHRINHLNGIRAQATGLQIVLQATAQLDGFPAAKAAFIQAAQNWENVIQTPITVVINVDYGPNRFGQGAYPPHVLGSTDGQVVGIPSSYTNVRSALVSSASSTQDTSLYASLPQSSVPTDIGQTTEVFGPTAVFRALGLLNAVADPTGEQQQLGPPPSIGFNSTFSFDFNPADGIDSGSYDFDGVATHEIGHVLGFVSQVGARELDSTIPVGVTPWDLYRFRPGVASGTFSTAQRVQSSGGEHIYFNGGANLELSTGRPDGSGGDGNQASHWKDSALTGVLIGIMDPAFPPGERRTITASDLAAVHSFGYKLTPGAPGSGTVTLTSGVPATGSITAAQPNMCQLAATQYTINVPDGSVQLHVDLNGDQDDVLFVRLGQPVTIQNQQAVADFVANQSSQNQSINVTSSTNPALTTGTYYVAVGNCTNGTMNYSVTAIVTSSGDTPPSISNLAESLSGNVLTLSGTANDPDADMTQADVVFLDGSGNALGTTTPFAFNFGAVTTDAFSIEVSNLQNYPTAVSATLTILDSRGNVSAPMTASFSGGDTGGPTVSTATFDGRSGVMVIRGTGFAGTMQLEVNGVIVGPPLKVKVKSKTKLKISGTGPQLNLKNGPNRVRVIENGLTSNILILTL